MGTSPGPGGVGETKEDRTTAKTESLREEIPRAYHLICSGGGGVKCLPVIAALVPSPAATSPCSQPDALSICSQNRARGL